MILAATKSADDTRDLAAQLAGVAVAGDVILLSGDLGAGKTTFTQGFGRGLGVPDRITSPTFTLVQTYVGRLKLVHVDVYRLDHLQEVVDLGLPELLDDRAVALIEWGEAAAPVLAPEFLRVRLEFGDDADERRLTIEPTGRAWASRPPAIRTALDRWTLA
jgi:tRNA threonylcarbamoyladenosine biosynthesis protein TsaE